MNTKKKCLPCGIMEDWFNKIKHIEDISITHNVDINELKSKVHDLESAVVGNVNLSLLLINTDKDWKGYSITNLGNIEVTNITVSGTVDGVDISAFKSDYDSKINQAVKTTSSPTFNNITVNGNVDGVDISEFKADYDSKINQAVKTTSSPTFVSPNISTQLNLTNAIAGIIKGNNQIKFYDKQSSGELQYADLISAQIEINGTTEHNASYLILKRGADNISWRNGIRFYPYGTISLASPLWDVGNGINALNDHDLNINHYDGESFYNMIKFKTDKTIDIPATINGITVNGNIGITGNFNASGKVLFGKVYPAQPENWAMYTTATNYVCSSGTWVKARYIKLGENLAGGVTISFCVYGSGNFQYEIRKNGTKIGNTLPLTAMDSSNCVTYSQTFNGINWAINDTIELWVYTATGTGYFRNFAINFVRQNEPSYTWS